MASCPEPPRPHLMPWSLNPESMVVAALGLACAALCAVARPGSLPRQGIARPIVPERALANLYRRAWQVAWRWRQNPQGELDFAAHTGLSADPAACRPWLVAQYGKYGWRLFPAGGELSALYARCRDGFLPGAEGAAPLMAWAEWDLYLVSGERARLEQVFPVLAGAYAWLQTNRRNSLGLYQGHDGAGCLAASCQMALEARSLAAIAAELGRADLADGFSADHRQAAAAINQHLWDDVAGWYREHEADAAARSAAGFWPLLAGVASPAQVEALVRRLTDPGEFWRPTPVPAVSAASPAYDPGEAQPERTAVRPEAEYMIVRGLLQAGRRGLAKTIALEYLRSLWAQAREGGGIWERTSAERDGGAGAPDVDGSASLGPIAMLIEAVLGLRVDARANALHWAPRLHLRQGMEGLAFGANTVSVTCAARAPARDYVIRTQADRAFTLRLATDFAAGTAWRGKKSLGPLREGTAAIRVKAGDAEYRISGEPAPDATPPAQPQRLAAVRAEGGALLRWQACADEDLAGYHVYRTEAHGWRKISAAPAIWACYQDDDPPPGGCRYAVAAVDLAGNTSPMSAPAELDRGREKPSAQSG